MQLVEFAAMNCNHQKFCVWKRISCCCVSTKDTQAFWELMNSGDISKSSNTNIHTDIFFSGREQHLSMSMSEVLDGT